VWGVGCGERGLTYFNKPTNLQTYKPTNPQTYKPTQALAAETEQTLVLHWPRRPVAET
jgi:hypothetical protein